VKLYLDVSCLNRPFDDQSQARIRLESEAITIILDQCANGVWDQVSSEIAGIVSRLEDRRRYLPRGEYSNARSYIHCSCCRSRELIFLPLPIAIRAASRWRVLNI